MKSTAANEPLSRFSGPEITPASFPSSRLFRLVLGLLFLTSFLAFLFARFHQAWDFPAFDGAYYFSQANRLINQSTPPQIEWSPLYTVFYSLFHLLPLSAFDVYFLHRVFSIALCACLLFLLLREFAPDLFSLACALLSVSGTAVLAAEHVVHLYSYLALMALLLVAIRAPTSIISLIRLTALSSLLPFLRVELLPVGITFAAALVLTLALRRQTFPVVVRRQAIAAAIFAALLITVFLVIRSDPKNNRGWIAFGQQYAWNVREMGVEQQLDSSYQFTAIMDRHFPGADGSIAKAIRINPHAFFRHVRWNLRHSFGAIAQATVPGVRWPRIEGLIFWISSCALLILVAVLQFHRITQALRRHFVAVALVATFLGCIYASSLIIRPKVDYFYPFLVPVYLSLASSTLLISHRYFRFACGFMLLASSATNAYVVIKPANYSHPYRTIVAKLQEALDPSAALHIAAFSGFTYEAMLGFDERSVTQVWPHRLGRYSNPADAANVFVLDRRVISLIRSTHPQPDRLLASLYGPDWSVVPFADLQKVLLINQCVLRTSIPENPVSALAPLAGVPPYPYGMAKIFDGREQSVLNLDFTPGALVCMKFRLFSASLVSTTSYSGNTPPMPILCSALAVYQHPKGFLLLDRTSRQSWIVEAGLEGAAVELNGIEGEGYSISAQGRRLGVIASTNLSGEWLFGRGFQQRYWAGAIRELTIGAP